jgi:membrane protein implicated in regulation of membrane protease activity
VIWLLTNVWWLVPLLIGGLALANLPMTLAVIRRVPVRVWLALAAVALLGLTFQSGRWVERREHRSAQEAAEKRADAKAGRVAKAAQERAEKARARIRQDTEESTDAAQDAVDALPATCPPLPDELRDIVQREVERARRGVPAEN